MIVKVKTYPPIITSFSDRAKGKYDIGAAHNSGAFESTRTSRQLPALAPLTTQYFTIVLHQKLQCKVEAGCEGWQCRASLATECLVAGV